MGRPPAYIFVVRHGARLDGADKRWHLTSPTPYDPPLTYGGWLQSMALGVRIASILRQAEADLNKTPNGRDSSTDSKKRRKFKVVLHSSPFLRCVQTSVAISAGLAQAPPSNTPSYPMPTSSPSTNPSASPFVLPAPAHEDVDPLSTDASEAKSEPPKKKKIKKSILRLDAFLGEWLSPEYFEMITPPPRSAMMLAGAKADLLRRENISVHDQIVDHAHHHANSVGQAQSQLWNSPKFRAAPERVPERSGSVDLNAPSIFGLDNVSSMTGALPRNRADSAASTSSQRLRFAILESSNPNEGYVPPTPNYAVSSNVKIPDGYVAHARDASVHVDYQWDSMRHPLDWGDGGKYGEEWTAMHHRFRNGVQKLVDWYSTAERPAEMVTKEVRTSQNGDTECAIDDEDDENVESVVILVSHGAGCNALIGAITHQPVLMDVGMASLTMAVRKPNRETVPSGMDTPMSEAGDPMSQPGVIPIHHYYDLKIFANTDHLRPSSSSTHNLSRAPSTASNSSVSNGQSGARGRIPTTNSIYTPAPITINPESFVFPGSRSTSANANLGSMRRTSHNNAYSLPRTPALNTTGITVGSGVTSFTNIINNNNTTINTNTSPTLSIGLWSPITPKKETEEEDEEDDIFPDFDHRKKLAALSKQGPEIVKPPTPERKEPQIGGPTKVPLRFQEISRPTSSDGTEEENKVPPLSFASSGLWGAPRPLGATEIMRDMTTSKRRWTVNERAQRI